MNAITPDQEAMISLLIYCSFGCLGLITSLSIWLLEWIRRRKLAQFKRKQFILDQLAIRGKSLDLLIEEVWKKNNQSPNLRL